MISDKFILNEAGEPVAAKTLRDWAQWYETCRDARKVKRETVGEAEVSTVFLSIDHAWGQSPPVLWETMVFGGALDQQQDRCSGGRTEAEAMHARMVERVKAEGKN